MSSHRYSVRRSLPSGTVTLTFASERPRDAMRIIAGIVFADAVMDGDRCGDYIAHVVDGCVLWMLEGVSPFVTLD